MTIGFKTDYKPLEVKFDSALCGLSENIANVGEYDHPVLQEGGGYNGIWLEGGPQEGLVYAVIDPEVARNNHTIFFDLQREDGYLPFLVRPGLRGSSQIQMVVPIAATGLELAEFLEDEHLLEQTYTACSRWDDWLVKYRNTRGTGLCEGFCEYDTGHDNSPRWKGLPKKCDNDDARYCPQADSLPYLSPDLSASVYGERVALEALARKLGRESEAQLWLEKAEHIRAAIHQHCFDPDDGCFYDLGSDNQFVRVKGDALTRVLGEHVVDHELFSQIYDRHIHNPDSFWPSCPLPSIAIDDPSFDLESSLEIFAWSGASHALTALRAPRWFEYYRKPADLAHMMQQWLNSLVSAEEFCHVVDPFDGTAVARAPGYSPALLVMIDYVARLYGVRLDSDELEWNCALPQEASTSQYILQTPRLTAKITKSGAHAELSLQGKMILQVEGSCRVVTDCAGRLKSIVGVAAETQTINITNDDATTICLQAEPNEAIGVATTILH